MKIEQAVFKRKSVRKYKMEDVDSGVEKRIESILNGVGTLYDNIQCEGFFVKDGLKVQKLFDNFISKYIKVKAPHYILITSQDKEGYRENVGYTFEKVVLELTVMGIGTCWIGAPFNREMVNSLVDIKEDHIPVCIIALGEPLDFYNMYRDDISQFKRESIEKLIVSGDQEKLKDALSYVRVAPSGINSQPWRFKLDEKSIQVMCIKRKNKFTKALYEKMNLIDIGIGLAHLEVGLKNHGMKFDLRKENVPEEKSIRYITTVDY